MKGSDDRMDIKVDMAFSETQYRDHLFPIMLALPERLRGDMMLLTNERLPTLKPHHVVLVAGWQDVARLRGRTRMIYVEHGAGQRYLGDRRGQTLTGYSGVQEQRYRGVIGFICPSQEVADRWTIAPSVAVGCPKMDRHIGTSPISARSICFVWHWDATSLPESRSAWSHYAPQLAEVVNRFNNEGWKVYGHAHPRWRGKLDQKMRDRGLEVLPTADEVFTRCGVMAVDNSSMGTEFMLLDRPVIWLNAPWYRLDVDHGGRFWDWTRSVTTIGVPDNLADMGPALCDTLQDSARSPDHAAGRRQLAESVYAVTDGSSSQKAAAWITGLVDSR